MSVPFDNIPSTLRVPFTFIEFNNTGAVQGTSQMPYKVLVIGQKVTAGTKAAGVITRVTSADEAKTYFGAGSLLHRMAVKYFANNRFTETHFVAIADAGGGVAATGTITFSGTTAAGTLYIYIGGKRLTVAVTASEAVADIATAVAAAINADTELPVTASPSAGVVTLTANWKGTTGNDIDVRLNYYSGEVTPTGLTATIVPMASGATDPDITSTLALMGNEHYNLIVSPYTDSANLTVLKTELDDRWGPTVQKEAFAIMAKRDTLANLATFGATQNTQFFVTLGIKNPPNPGYEIAAALGAVIAYYGNIDPARPFQTLELKGILPPAESDRFTLEENNSLLYDGIATSYVDAGGSVRIQRVITMYRLNAAGAADTSYLDLNTVLTLAYLRYDLRNLILTRFPRHKLANDGTRFSPGQAIVTPKAIKAELVARFRLWEENGLVENLDAFKAGLIVERNGSDANRVDILLTPDVINQFIVGAAQIKFLL